MAVQQLLAPPSPEDAQIYYRELLQAVQTSTVGTDTAEGFEVRLDSGAGKGKGLFATRCFEEGMEVLREAPFAAVQCHGNRADCLNCNNCFRFVGSVELQIAWRLLARMSGSGSSMMASELREMSSRLLSGSVRLPHPHLTKLPAVVLCPGGCDEVYCSTRCCAEAWARHHCLLCSGQCRCERIAHLRRLAAHCPYIKPFNLADLLKWPHDCEAFKWLLDAYGLTNPHANCSTRPSAAVPSRALGARSDAGASTSASGSRLGARTAAVRQFLVSWPPAEQLPAQPTEAANNLGGRAISATDCAMSCDDENAPPPMDVSHAAGPQDSAASASDSGRCTLQILPLDLRVGLDDVAEASARPLGGEGPLPTPPWVDVCVSRDTNAQLQEYAHKKEIDAICFVAQIIAQTMCTALLLVWSGAGTREGNGVLTSHQRAAMARYARLLPGGGAGGPCGSADEFHAALLAAWQPMQMAMKQPWWDCASVPQFTDPEVYKNSIRVLMANVATLLKAAIFDERFAALFSVDIVANLVGMSEFNAIGVTVESPLEDYFDTFKSLMASAKLRQPAAAEEVAACELALRLRDHYLEQETDIPCDGLAFYCIQSCLNHDDQPNCSCQKDIDETDGSAVCTALQTIKPGEELCFSYIGRASEMAPSEAKAALAAYGIPVLDSCCPDNSSD